MEKTNYRRNQKKKVEETAREKREWACGRQTDQSLNFLSYDTMLTSEDSDKA